VTTGRTRCKVWKKNAIDGIESDEGTKGYEGLPHNFQAPQYYVHYWSVNLG
jgi:hypothetical protein